MAEDCDRSYLRLSLRLDTWGEGELSVMAQADGFGGRTHIWLTAEKLLQFACDLEAYPLPPENDPQLSGGYYRGDGSGELAEEVVYIAARQVNARGTIGIQVRLRSPWSHRLEFADDLTVQLEFHTTYQRIADFARALRNLARGDTGEAILTP